MGTLINALSIIVGSIIGMFFRKGIKDEYQLTINQALGLSILLIGLNGVLTNMFIVVDNVIKSQYELLLVVSLSIGSLIGAYLNIDGYLNSIAHKLEKRFKITGFALGFVNASLVFCIGAMAIIGSINDGIFHDTSTLLVKSMLDFVTCIILTSSLGIGVLFSAFSVLLYQGSITLFASYLNNFLSPEILAQICCVGYSLLMLTGLNFMNITKIKVANFLPAILIAALLATLI